MTLTYFILALMSALICPKCASEMEEGLLLDKTGQGSFSASEWTEGAPERSFWTGLKLKGHVRHPVVTYRCGGCGYLESFARAAE